MTWGGGTLDIAIAESIGGRVNLLAHGGIAMCGGRDFDRVLVDNVVRPWLLENFDLPEDFSVNPSFKSLLRLAIWATERAKIELSAREDSVISLSETEAWVRDLNGNEIYLDIPLQRDTYDKLIAERVGESIESARETLNKAGLSPHDLERIVFVGGPTNYKPLRDKVAFELRIPGNTDVNPMTAVAEGASLFAESIDWSSQNQSRKNTRGQISSGGGLALSFNYIARTPDVKAKIAVQLTGQCSRLRVSSRLRRYWLDLRPTASQAWRNHQRHPDKNWRQQLQGICFRFRRRTHCPGTGQDRHYPNRCLSRCHSSLSLGRH